MTVSLIIIIIDSRYQKRSNHIYLQTISRKPEPKANSATACTIIYFTLIRLARYL